ncbi:hypothetical protein DXG01_012509 [Tephrocybe rancida]|nr:hypothetical protein DXG01_012509 [Tephrocybe rancida]
MASTQEHTPGSSRKFILASRASQLAQVQTNSVLASLQEIHPPPGGGDSGHEGPTFSTSFMATGGDKNQSQALYLFGGKALWTKELEVGLREREVDMIIHCLKDVPTALPEGCLIGAVLKRENPVDSLVVKSGKPWKNLKDLPEGSVLGTSSVRRVAQLKRNYPALKFLDVVSNHALGGSREGWYLDLGCVTALAGDVHVEHVVQGRVTSADEAEELGSTLAKTLSDLGAKKILDDINVDRDRRVTEAEKADKENT